MKLMLGRLACPTICPQRDLPRRQALVEHLIDPTAPAKRKHNDAMTACRICISFFSASIDLRSATRL